MILLMLTPVPISPTILFVDPRFCNPALAEVRYETQARATAEGCEQRERRGLEKRTFETKVR